MACMADFSFEMSSLWRSTSGEDLADPMNSVKAELPVSTLRKLFPTRYTTRAEPSHVVEVLQSLIKQNA